MKMAPFTNLAGVVFFLLFLLTGIITAQTQLFNIPTSEVADTGSRYLELDFDSHLASYRFGGYQGFGFTGVYGLHKKVEIGLNGYIFKDADGWSPLEIQPNIKFQVYESKKKGISVAAGTVAFIPLSKRWSTDPIANIYAVAGKKFEGKFGPSIHAGAYAIAGRTNDQRYGFLTGIEQPVNERVTIIADWTSGNNRFGYATAGLGVALTQRSTLYAAYYVGNEGRGNNSLGLYYSYSF